MRLDSKTLLFILSIVVFTFFCNLSYAYVDSTHIIDTHIDTGTKYVVSIDFRSLDNFSGLLWFDSIDSRLYINNCPRYYNTNLTFRKGITTYKFSYISYLPINYNLWFGINNTNGSLLYNDTILVYSTGDSLNDTNITNNAENCLLYSIPNHKALLRYGYDPKVNIPLERLRNHTIGLDLEKMYSNISKNVSVSVIATPNISNSPIIINNTNTTDNINISFNNSLVFDNQDEINKETYKNIIITFSIFIIIVGITLWLTHL